MLRRRFLNTSIPLIANLLFSWTLLPFVIPPFGGYSLSDFLEVLLWQGMGIVGWPIALVGLGLGMAFGAKLASALSLLLILLYPAFLFLFIRSLVIKTPRRAELILMHLFVTISFGVVWYYVLNGYDFMPG